MADGGEFVIDYHASSLSIGTVLSQYQKGQENVIAYASGTLSQAESNFCVTKREYWLWYTLQSILSIIYSEDTLK